MVSSVLLPRVLTRATWRNNPEDTILHHLITLGHCAACFTVLDFTMSALCSAVLLRCRIQ
jgi:hypothetical protein